MVAKTEITNEEPRVTEQMVEDNISAVIYKSGLSGLDEAELAGLTPEARETLRVLTICIIISKSAFSFDASSAPVSPGNYDAAKGREVSYAKARTKMWNAMGYELKQRIFEGRV